MRGTALRRHLATLIGIAVTAVVLAVYTGALAARSTRDLSNTELEETAGMIRRLLARRPGALLDLDAMAKTLGSERVRVTFVRVDGRVLGDSRADPSIMETHRDREEVREALGGVVGHATRVSASVGEELLYLALPPMDYEGTALIVRVSAPAAASRALARQAQGAIAAATAIILTLVSLLAWRAQKRLIDPIQQLERAAAAYAAGRFDFGLRVTWPPDLARVAESMRSMADSLRQRMAEATHRTRELETILGSMTEAVVVLDTDLRILGLNLAATHLARTTDAVARGRSLLEVFRNTELNEFARRLLAGSEPLEGTVTLEGPTHAQVHAARLQPALGTATGLDGMVLVLSDITRLRKLEEVRRDFVANVSHELKTPITAVKGYLDTLLGGALDDPKNARRFTETAARHADRLGAIVDDLLSLSKLEEKAEVLGDVEECDLCAIARSVVESYQPLARKKRITLTQAGQAPAVVFGNPRLLEQAVSNLVDNAVKYTDPGGSVTVEVTRKDSSTALSVVDTGVGIPAKDLPRVFERFYRVDKERSRDLGGTGLGLSVVRHIALAHGGTVEAASTPGVGSTFTLILPARGTKTVE